MIGLGTIINCGSVLAGASVGMLLKNGLSKRFEDTIMQGIGLCTMFIGIGGALSGLLTLENGQLSTQHTMLLILSLALGALIGEALNIEKHLEDFGIFCQDRLKSQGDSHFVEGFVSFSLLICIGAMAVSARFRTAFRATPRCSSRRPSSTASRRSCSRPRSARAYSCPSSRSACIRAA